MKDPAAHETRNAIQQIKGLMLLIHKQLDRIDGALDKHYKGGEKK